MSVTNQNNNKNYSIYDNMSTEMLEEILKSDFQMSHSENSDINTILYITEVIADREKEKLEEKFTDVHTAWGSFAENYLPHLKDNKSLYDDEDIRESIKRKQILSIKLSSLQRRIHIPLVLSKIVIIILLLSFTGTITTKAFGFDLWDTVADWTKDIFGFSSEIANKQDPNGLREVLDKYNIKAEVAPTWFPTGYLFENVDVVETPLRTTIHSIYSSENDDITVTIISLVNPSSSMYEKDNNDVIIYSSNKIQHYIMKNLERTKIVWKIDNYECSITGNFSIKEAEKMIDSIYTRR